MLPYSAGLILDSSHNYGIVKTETLFGFSPKNSENLMDNVNSTEPLQWIFSHGNLERSLEDTSRSFKTQKPKLGQSKKKKNRKALGKKIHKHKGKGCIYKVLKKKNRRQKFKAHKKYMVPMLLGIMAAKSILIPVALKALAFISAKGLMMGFFSTIMASLLSLKGMFDHSHGYQNRKDDTKTQVEIIQVPSNSDDHIYHDEHYRRGGYPQTPQSGMVVG